MRLKIFRKFNESHPKNLKGQFHNFHAQKTFAKIVDREIARVNRTGHGFSIVNFNFKNLRKKEVLLRQLINTLSKRLRLTDEMGWIDAEHVGVLLYNTNSIDAYNFVKDIQKKQASTEFPLDYDIFVYPQNNIENDSGNQITQKDSNEVATVAATKKFQDSQASFQNIEKGRLPSSTCSNSKAIKECATSVQHIKTVYRRKMPIWKRCLDITGAVLGLAISSPILILISSLIKIVSPGAIFFKQERLGYGGKHFTFLKFRTMNIGADTSVHQQYLSKLINSSTQCSESGSPMAKMDADNTQIIPFGRILRNTYLDELPQFINVLKGEMSLIGPRPPIPYEVEEYLEWHKGRFDAVPGMTGLWQVSGKNRLTFKEMIRLDIQYTRTQSFLLDLKILLKTPFAILSEIISGRKDINLMKKGIKQNA
jgi:lipopolysaccharide/colanic/teichoic acid biosynthesis glycosyltransferase